jgi:hypothetical protein
MCFSATASFTAAAVLGAVGAATLAQKPDRKSLAFALIPTIFAAHQLIEGFIWLALDAGGKPPTGLIVAYLIIAQVLWPAYMPAAVLLMERARRRPWALWVLLATGLFVSGALASVLMQHHYSVSAVGDGLRYATEYLFEHRLLGLYLVVTTAPLFLSRHRYVVAFGTATLLGSIVTMLAFYDASASVWCFFSALASIFVFLHVRQSRRSAPKVSVVEKTTSLAEA